MSKTDLPALPKLPTGLSWNVDGLVCIQVTLPDESGELRPMNSAIYDPYDKSLRRYEISIDDFECLDGDYAAEEAIQIMYQWALMGMLE